MRAFLAGICVLAALAGCSTMQVVESPGPQVVREEVEAGDRVKLRTADGQALMLEVTRVDREFLHGTGHGRRY